MRIAVIGSGTSAIGFLYHLLKTHPEYEVDIFEKGMEPAKRTAKGESILYGFGGAGIEVAELRTPHPSEKLLCDMVRADANNVTIVALGPLTNVARAFQRDPELPSLVRQVVIAGGTISGPGNITPA